MRSFKPMLVQPVADEAAANNFRRLNNWLGDLEKLIGANFRQDHPGGIPTVVVPPGSGVSDHGLLTGLADDDHLQYLLLAGRALGQVANGGIAAGEDLTLSSTAHATKGLIKLGDADLAAYDDVLARLGIGLITPLAKLHVMGEPAAVEYRVPVADNGSIGGWTANSGVAPIFSRIDERDTVGTVDTDFIQSSNFTSYYCNIAGGAAPSVGQTVTIKVRGRLPVGASTFLFDFVENTTTSRFITTSGVLNLTTGFVTYPLVLTAAEVAAVTDWNNLQFKFLKTGNDAEISAAWMEITGGGGGKTAIFQAVSGQVETLSEWQSAAAAALIAITTAGRLTVESGGSFRHVPGAGLGRLLKSDANGDMSMFGLGSALQVIRVNAGGTDLEFASPAAAGVEQLGIYGNGPDGSYVLDGALTYTGLSKSGSNYFLTRDFYMDDLQIDVGVTLDTAGFRLFGMGDLLNNGTLYADGAPGAAGANAVSVGTPLGGAGGVAASAVTAGGNTAGTAGRNGATTAGSGATATPSGAAGEGGSGGAGGNGEPGGFGAAGGTGGVGTAQTVLRHRSTTSILFIQDYALGYQLIQGGTGGRGGASGGGDGTSRGGAGGGGGAGGRVCPIWFRNITNNGTISARGGNGGAGGNSDALGGGAGGGGGGGGGGLLWLYYDVLVNTGTISAAGGTGGAAGTAGGFGTPTAGVNGSTGTVIKYCRLDGTFN